MINVEDDVALLAFHFEYGLIRELKLRDIDIDVIGCKREGLGLELFEIHRDD